MAHFRALALVVIGLALIAAGSRVLVTGRMRVRKPRPQDSAAVLRQSAFIGARARSRGALFVALGGVLAILGVYGLVTTGP